MFRTEVARQFIGDAALPPNPPVDFGDESAEESVPFDAGAAPGAVVSSALIAWDEDTPTDIRQAVSDSLLFAQLFADKSVPDRNDVKQWMTNYFNVLPNIGWTLTSDVRDETEEDALARGPSKDSRSYRNRARPDTHCPRRRDKRLDVIAEHGGRQPLDHLVQ